MTSSGFAESDGPDKLKNHYGCYLHHSGIRTFDTYRSVSGKAMVTDYDCCCDPCNYTKGSNELLLQAKGERGNTEENPYVSGTNYCCSCTPNLIVARWQGDFPEDECSEQPFFVPMWVDFYGAGDNTSANYARYTGTLFNRQLDVYLSNFNVTEAGNTDDPDGSGCRWTMWLAASGSGGGGGGEESSGGGDEEEGGSDVGGGEEEGGGEEGGGGGGGGGTPGTRIVSFIDHVSGTCLNVPDFSISGIVGAEGSGGTLTLHNYYADKVPFVRRADSFGDPTPIGSISGEHNGVVGREDFTPAQTGLSILLPSGRISPPTISAGFDVPFVNATGGDWVEGQEPTGVIYPTGVTKCSYVPRYMCVDTNAHGSNGAGFREFVFDSGFYPTERVEFHPSYTGIEYFTTGNVLCRWVYTPENYEVDPDLIADGTHQWHNPTNDKYKKYLYLYETFIDNVAEYSGDMNLVHSSGVPRYILLPAFSLDPNPVNTSDLVMWDVASESGYYSPQNRVSVAYWSHPGIHYASYPDLSDIQLREQNELFYWSSGLFARGDNRSPWTGGIRHAGGGVSDSVYGDGYDCPCHMTAYANNSPSPSVNYILNIRPGRCGCWSYYCSDRCRCVPRKLCMFSFEATIAGGYSATFFRKELTWDKSTKCWTAGESGIQLCLERSENGYQEGAGKETYTPACIAPTLGSTGTNYYLDQGYDLTFTGIEEQVVTCDSDFMSFQFSDIIFDGGGNAQSGVAVYIYPSYAGDCDYRVGCDDASPCASGCNHHPNAISMDLQAYSVYDEDECAPRVPAGGDCSRVYNITLGLLYFEDYSLVDNAGFPELEVDCGYRGFLPCGTGVLEVIWKGGADGLEIDGDLSYGNSNTAGAGGGVGWDGSGPTQFCDPYYVSGTWLEGGALNPVWFDCEDSGNARWDMIITEV